MNPTESSRVLNPHAHTHTHTHTQHTNFQSGHLLLMWATVVMNPTESSRCTRSSKSGLTCVSVSLCVCICICIIVCMYMYTCHCVYVCIYPNALGVQSCVCVCMHVCMTCHIKMRYIRTYTQIHAYKATWHERMAVGTRAHTHTQHATMFLTPRASLMTHTAPSFCRHMASLFSLSRLAWSSTFLRSTSCRHTQHGSADQPPKIKRHGSEARSSSSCMVCPHSISLTTLTNTPTHTHPPTHTPNLPFYDSSYPTHALLPSRAKNFHHMDRVSKYLSTAWFKMVLFACACTHISMHVPCL